MRTWFISLLISLAHTPSQCVDAHIDIFKRSLRIKSSGRKSIRLCRQKAILEVWTVERLIHLSWRFRLYDSESQNSVLGKQHSRRFEICARCHFILSRFFSLIAIFQWGQSYYSFPLSHNCTRFSFRCTFCSRSSLGCAPTAIIQSVQKQTKN